MLNLVADRLDASPRRSARRPATSAERDVFCRVLHLLGRSPNCPTSCWPPPQSDSAADPPSSCAPVDPAAHRRQPATAATWPTPATRPRSCCAATWSAARTRGEVRLRPLDRPAATRPAQATPHGVHAGATRRSPRRSRHLAGPRGRWSRQSATAGMAVHRRARVLSGPSASATSATVHRPIARTRGGCGPSAADTLPGGHRIDAYGPTARHRPHRRRLGGAAPRADRTPAGADRARRRRRHRRVRRAAGRGRAHVTVVDASPDALAALTRRAADAGVAERVRAVQGDGDALADLVAPGSADLVLCHACSRSSTTRPRWSPRSPARCAPAARPACWSPTGRPRCWPGRSTATSTSPPRCSPTRTAAPGRGTPLRRRYDAEAAARAAARGRPRRRGDPRRTGGRRPGARPRSPRPTAQALLDLELAAAARPPYRDIATQLHLFARRP